MLRRSVDGVIAEAVARPASADPAPFHSRAAWVAGHPAGPRSAGHSRLLVRALC